MNCNREEKKCYNSDFQKFNTGINNIKRFCSLVTQYANVGVSYCLPACLSLLSEPIFAEYRLNYECGFSDRLLLYAGNIIKWVKYIVPIIVIIMGILDFIKAMNADKDDEMKKAQKRFIKRIIAAALIFITPIIIEFILTKMGFAANGCGIIDL